MRLIDFLPVSFGLAFITMFVDKQSRRLGDLAAGTLVIIDRPETTLDSLRPLRPVTGALSPTDPPSPPVEAGAPPIPVERLTDRDIQMVEEYFRRRFQLADRIPLARQVAEALHKRMEIPYTLADSRELELWLSNTLKAYRARQR
jgi:hypothetical protein